MAASKVHFYTDRSAIEADWSCGMRYWWNRLEGGTGIVPVTTPNALEVGIEIHEDLAAVSEMDLTDEALSGYIDRILSTVPEADRIVQAKMEQVYRRAGWFAAFALFMEPRIRAEFTTEMTEGELILDRDPLWIATTPDRILRHRTGSYLVYRDYKSALQAGQKWSQSWMYALQLHIGMKAIEEEWGERPAYAQTMGLLKGDRRGGRLAHPYTWAYRNGSNWTHDYSKARGAAWEPAPVWEYPGGILEWVKRLGPEVGLQQFPHSVPVPLNDRLIEQVVDARVGREYEIANVKEDCQYDLEVRRLYFEPRLKSCRPAYGEDCPYLAACHNATINENPLASGLYQTRVPHHEVEVTLVNDGPEQAQNER